MALKSISSFEIMVFDTAWLVHIVGDLIGQILGSSVWLRVHVFQT